MKNIAIAIAIFAATALTSCGSSATTTQAPSTDTVSVISDTTMSIPVTDTVGIADTTKK